MAIRPIIDIIYKQRASQDYQAVWTQEGEIVLGKRSLKKTLHYLQAALGESYVYDLDQIITNQQLTVGELRKCFTAQATTNAPGRLAEMGDSLFNTIRQRIRLQYDITIDYDSTIRDVHPELLDDQDYLKLIYDCFAPEVSQAFFEAYWYNVDEKDNSDAEGCTVILIFLLALASFPFISNLFEPVESGWSMLLGFLITIFGLVSAMALYAIVMVWWESRTTATKPEWLNAFPHKETIYDLCQRAAYHNYQHLVSSPPPYSREDIDLISQYFFARLAEYPDDTRVVVL